MVSVDGFLAEEARERLLLPVRERRRNGSALLTTLFLIMGMFGMAALTMSVGQGYLARGQLQISADAAATAAADRLRTGKSQLEARVLAQIVGEGTIALEGAVDMVDSDVVFGDFDHRRDLFTAGGTRYSPAVQVNARRNNASPGGPIDLLMGSFVGATQAQVSARAVASTGCREIVFAVDWSASMEEEIDEAWVMVQAFTDYVRNFSRPGDKIGIAIFAGDALSMKDYADNSGPFWSRPRPDEMSLIPSDLPDISTFVNALQLHGDNCELLTFPVQNRDDTKLPTLRDGSCVGKGDHHGIYKAIEMFDDLEDSCSSEGERLIILITSRAPCRMWTRQLGGGWRGRWFGGTAQEAYEAADAALAEGISVAPVLIDRGQLGHQQCLSLFPTGWQFAQNMKRGFTQASLVNPIQTDVTDLVQQLNEVLFVRLVE